MYDEYFARSIIPTLLLAILLVASEAVYLLLLRFDAINGVRPVAIFLPISRPVILLPPSFSPWLFRNETHHTRQYNYRGGGGGAGVAAGPAGPAGVPLSLRRTRECPPPGRGMHVSRSL